MTAPTWDKSSVSVALPDGKPSLVAACIQLNSGSDVDSNMARAESLLQQAANAGAQLALLPENFALMSEDDDCKQHFAHHQLQPTITHLQRLSQQLKLWIIAGGIVTPIANSPKLHNSSLLFSPDGGCHPRYHKIHLFDAALHHQEAYHESRLFEAGSTPVHINIAGWQTGLSICFDLRFPELFWHYKTAGCDIITVPAAFTATTGVDHWLPLLQARAIETQSFILAAAQTGKHPNQRTTWGHSTILDPWGKILAIRPEGEGMIMTKLERSRLTQTQQAIPTTHLAPYPSTDSVAPPTDHLGEVPKWS